MGLYHAARRYRRNSTYPQLIDGGY